MILAGLMPHIGIFHPPGCRARIRVFADVDAVGRTFSDRLCVGAARGRLRIWCVLGGNDRRVRWARRRPVFARQATMAKRAGPPPLAEGRIGSSGELANCATRSKTRIMLDDCAQNSQSPGGFSDEKQR